MKLQIPLALMTAFSAGALALLIHLIIWRIRRPEAYPIWLPAIFGSAGVIVFGGMSFFGYKPLSSDFIGTLAGLFLYSLFSVNYVMWYAGIIEYSPSAEILYEVLRHEPEGVSVDALDIRTLSDEVLVGRRIRHLISAEMVREQDGGFEVTAAGRRVMQTCIIFRRMLLQPPFGEG